MVYAGNNVPVELPQRLSPSRLADFRQCPAKFFYGSIVKLPRPATVATTIGTLAHTAFENIFDHPREDRTVERAVAYVRPAWDELRTKEAYVHLLDQAEEIVSGAEHAVKSWFGVERPHNFDPVGRELRLISEVSGLPLLGILDRVDRVEVDGTERVYISDYKGLALDTPLPTPTGWTTMGEVQVGDSLIGADGRPTTVTVKSEIHNRPCFEVVFADGSIIVADNVHLWGVSEKDVYEVLSTEELRERVAANGFVKLPRRSPMVGSRQEFDINAAAQWLNNESEHGEAAARLALRADLVQRKALLCALHTTPAEDDESIRTTLVLDKTRAEVLLELLATFSYPTESVVSDAGVVVEFLPETVQWEVVEVRPCDSVPTQCVQIDAPSSLYLAGRSMMVTHNTGKVPAIDDRFLDEKFFAMRVYALLWHTVHGEVPHELRLIYVKGGTRDSVRRLRVDEALITKVKKELKAIHSEMKSSAKAGRFECKKQPLCQWCDFMEICPQWHPELEGLTVGDIRAKVTNGQDSLFDTAV